MLEAGEKLELGWLTGVGMEAEKIQNLEKKKKNTRKKTLNAEPHN